MATDGRTLAIIETSVLVNFLVIDRADLLAQHPNYRFVVLDMVRAEVIKRHQLARLDAALAAGHLIADGPPESTSLEELAHFASMASLKLGQGEKAAGQAAMEQDESPVGREHRGAGRVGPGPRGLRAGEPRTDGPGRRLGLARA